MEENELNSIIEDKVAKSVYNLITVLPDWDVSQIDGDVCKDIMYKHLKKVLSHSGNGK